MQTQCPNCHTIYQVTREQLNTAHGKVRCGHCQYIFPAAQNVYTPEQNGKRGTEKRLKNTQLMPHEPKQVIIDDEGGSNVEQQDLESLRFASDNTPPPMGFDDDESSGSRTRFWLINASAAIALCALMAFQYLFHNRSELIRSATYAPAVKQMCELVGCNIAPQRAPDLLELVSMDVRAHKDYSNALLVNLSIHNGAEFPQPYPTIKMSFHSTNGSLSAQRYLKPEQYLEGYNPLRPDSIGSFSNAIVVMELVDPGEGAISYQFDFL